MVSTLARISPQLVWFCAFGGGMLFIALGYLPLNRIGAFATLAAALCLPLITIRLAATLGALGIPRWLDLICLGAGLFVAAWYLLLVFNRSPFVDAKRLRRR